MANEEDLLARLEAWLSQHPQPAGLADILETRDAELLGAFILKAFRAAAKGAVLDRMDLEARTLRAFADGGDANPVLRIFSNIARAWQLTGPERLALLGLGAAEDFESLRGLASHQLPVAVLERVAILLDIFQAINTLLPIPERADAWMHAPNSAPLLGGRSALNLMCESLDGLRQVRRYLQAEIWAG